MPKRTPSAAEELERLLARRRELVAGAQDADGRGRATQIDVRGARAAVGEAQRRVLAGDGSAEALEAAERKLAEARELAATPWAERAAGARSAVRDVEREINLHVARHFKELARHHNDKAREAA